MMVVDAGPGARARAAGVDGVPRMDSLAQAVRLVERSRETLYVRVSGGPAVDRCTVSRDHESGCVLPGLSVNPLSPEPWWDRPVEHWVARQLTQYAHLADDGSFAWLLTGEVSGRGPDCEPLLVAVRPVAVLEDAALAEARGVYERVLDHDDRGED
ncbi:DUF6098 family protein [Luteimicrobium sp. DT211]|uniref:DUF6098 family protein n=1 Tax=Luteimicrobium sp. DT211 TaxID=3393412 RepID=UPI003CEEDEFB